jgi:hypothetical protein
LSFPFRESIARTTALSLFATAVVLAAPAAAIADNGPAPSPPAVDQYREGLPTAGSPSGGSDSKQARAALPPNLRARLRASGTPDAQILSQIATSPTYGAPQQRLTFTDSRDATSFPPHAQGDVPQEAAQRKGGTDETIARARRVIGLLVIMVVLLAGLTAFALVRRRRATGAVQLLAK